MRIELIINPKPASRPRLGRNGAYNLQAYTDYKNELKQLFIEWGRNREHIYFTKAIRVDIDFHIPMAESWTDKKKKTYIGQPHTQTPDKDNLEKAVLDACTGIFFEDDAIVFDGRTRKIWSDAGKIIINIIEA